jgi:hypothetical protein
MESRREGLACERPTMTVNHRPCGCDGSYKNPGATMRKCRGDCGQKKRNLKVTCTMNYNGFIGARIGISLVVAKSQFVMLRVTWQSGRGNGENLKVALSLSEFVDRRFNGDTRTRRS